MTERAVISKFGEQGETMKSSKMSDEPSALRTRLGSLPGAISHAISSLAGSLP